MNSSPATATGLNKKQGAAIALILWLTIILVFMLLVQRFDLMTFIFLMLIGVLVITQFLKQQYVQPGYMRYLDYLMVVGFVIFGVLVLKKVIEFHA
jgi:4-hydroxybenzoate polyprenyltransferase